MVHVARLKQHIFAATNVTGIVNVVLFNIISSWYHWYHPVAICITFAELFQTSRTCSITFASKCRMKLTNDRYMLANFTSFLFDSLSLPRWRRGSGLNCGSDDPGSITGLPSPRWALWWQGGNRRLWTSRCPCRGRLGTLKTPSCPWRWVPGSRSKFGNWTSVPSLYSWNIAEWDVKPQPTNQFDSLNGYDWSNE